MAKNFDPREAVRRAVEGYDKSPSGIPLTPWCPRCGAPECHPANPNAVLIRGYKVDDWSECLVCASAYAPNGQGYDENLAWQGGRPDAPAELCWFSDGGRAAAVTIYLT